MSCGDIRITSGCPKYLQWNWRQNGDLLHVSLSLNPRMIHSPWDVLKDKRIIGIYDNEHGASGEGIEIAGIEAVALLVRRSARRFATPTGQTTASVDGVAFQAGR